MPLLQKLPRRFHFGGTPRHQGVCGQNYSQLAPALDLLGVSQASSVAIETGCLWPQRLPQDLRPLTQTLASLPLKHSQRQGLLRGARSERRRERE